MRALLLPFLSFVVLLSIPACVYGAVRNAAPSFPFSDVEGDEALSFTVLTQDPQLNITTVGMAPSSFTGTALPLSPYSNFTLNVNVMLPHVGDDITACDSPWNTTNEYLQPFTGAFVLLLRSLNCQTPTSLNAAASGAAGIILQGCSPDAPTFCNARLQNDYTFVMIPVPVIVITYAQGEQLRQFLVNKRAAAVAVSAVLPANTLEVQFISTGPIVQAERDALITIMTKTTMSFFQAYTPEPIPYWTLARFQNMSLDPCRDRVKGIWCEKGHVVQIATNFHAWVTPNGIPDEFGAFTAMKVINVETNLWSGPIPDAWCNMTDLRSLQIGSQFFGSGQGITRLPNCLWPKLTAYHFTGNNITSLPPNWTGSTQLVRVYGSNNHITSFPSLVNLTKLEILDFSSNGATGSLPTLASTAPLQAIAFGNNQLTSVDPNNFNNMGQLQILDLNTNKITGPLPNLINTPALITLDLSSQRNLADPTSVGFTGPMPASWKSLVNVQTLYLQENNITSPIYTSSMVRVVTMDLSNNALTRATDTAPLNTDFDIFMLSALSSSVVSARFSNNPTLAGDMGIFASFLNHKGLQEFYLDHCGLTSLFDAVFTGGLVTLDVSYNNIDQDHISAPGAGSDPPPVMKYFSIDHNPKLRLTSLPSWMEVQDSRVQQPGQSYTCAPLKAASSPLMTITFDAELYNFQYCDCVPGNFGKAPQCSPIPTSAQLNPGHIITSDQIGANFPSLIEAAGGLGSQLSYNSTNNVTTYSQAFSDTMYGSQDRLMQGLSTAYVVDLTDLYQDDIDAYAALDQAAPSPLRSYTVPTGTNAPSMTTPVRVIHIRLHISAVDFIHFDDSISIYEGGTDLKGNRILALRGTDTLPLTSWSAATTTPEYIQLYNASISQLQDPRLLEVQVFANKATMQFDNRQPTGRYFFATYSYDFVCPAGYFYDTVTAPSKPQCRANYEIYRVGDGIRNAVFAISAVALAFVTFNIVILIWKWDSLIFKAASRAFMLIILIMLEALALGALLYAAVPTDGKNVSKAVCIGRPWLTCLPLACILGVLLAKTARLNTIFNAKTLQVQTRTDLDILITVLIVCALQIALLAVFTGIPLSRPQLALGKGGFSDRLVTGCSEETGFMSWFGAEVAFISALILPAIYLGFKTRDLPSQYNESSHIQNAVVLLAFFGVIIIPLDIFIQDDPTAAILIQGLGQAFLCLILTIIIFGPKLYYLTSQGGKSSLVKADTVLPTAMDTSDTTPNTTNVTRKNHPATPVAGTARGSIEMSGSVPYPQTTRPSATMKSGSSTPAPVNMATPSPAHSKSGSFSPVVPAIASPSAAVPPASLGPSALAGASWSNQSGSGSQPTSAVSSSASTTATELKQPTPVSAPRKIVLHLASGSVHQPPESVQVQKEGSLPTQATTDAI